ncbi:MAG TPA: hypothetical protein VMV05_10495 [bacterium]|nr:hypothetical protein [bacterium]
MRKSWTGIAAILAALIAGFVSADEGNMGTKAVTTDTHPSHQAKKTGPTNGPASKLMEEKGIYYYDKHDDSGHHLVPGNNKGVSIGPKENLVNFVDGDPDRPIPTGKTNHRSAGTHGRNKIISPSKKFQTSRGVLRLGTFQRPSTITGNPGKNSSPGEMNDQTSLRLQKAMDNRSKSYNTLSNVLRKQNDSSQGITKNLK